MIRLNLGCGPDIAHGWTNADVVSYDTWPTVGSREWVAYGPQLLTDPLELPWHDGWFDGVVAHHVAQMMPWPQLVPWLEEIRRVMKPRGWLRMTLPDLRGAVSAHDAGDEAWFPIDDAIAPTIGEKLCVYLTQNGASRSVFTGQAIARLCSVAGFFPVGWRTLDGEAAVPTFGPSWLTELDSRLEESIVVEARA